MFVCPNCGITFREQRDLLTHFFHERKCWSVALWDCVKRGVDRSVWMMIFDTCYGRINPESSEKA